MRLSDEHGITLAEVLIAMLICLGLLGAVLLSFNNFYQLSSDNDKRNDTTEVARNALDTQVRQLRNLAKRVQSPVIDTLGSYDLIFQTSDPSRTWVRYCLNTSSPASVDSAQLWTAELAVASSASGSPVTRGDARLVPGIGLVADVRGRENITNRRGGRDRPMFTYLCITGTSSCATSAATYDQVVNIGALLLVDTTPNRVPEELRVVSSVYLRNQNQAPVAAFVSSRGSSSRTLVFNASGSSDYEGRTMDYYWFKDTMPAQASIDCARATDARHVALGLVRLHGGGDHAESHVPQRRRRGRHEPQHRACRLRPGRPLRHHRHAAGIHHRRADPSVRKTMRNHSSEEGSVLVIAIILLSVMIAIGLSSFAFVDTGQSAHASSASARRR